MHSISTNYTLFLAFWAKDEKNWLATSVHTLWKMYPSPVSLLVSDDYSSCHSSMTHLNFNQILVLLQLNSLILPENIFQSQCSINKVAVFDLKVEITYPPPLKSKRAGEGASILFFWSMNFYSLQGNIIVIIFTSIKFWFLSPWLNFIKRF